jgi:hypothetical protein
MAKIASAPKSTLDEEIDAAEKAWRRTCNLDEKYASDLEAIEQEYGTDKAARADLQRQYAAGDAAAGLALGKGRQRSQDLADKKEGLQDLIERNREVQKSLVAEIGRLKALRLRDIRAARSKEIAAVLAQDLAADEDCFWKRQERVLRRQALLAELVEFAREGIGEASTAHSTANDAITALRIRLRRVCEERRIPRPVQLP